MVKVCCSMEDREAVIVIGKITSIVVCYCIHFMSMLYFIDKCIVLATSPAEERVIGFVHDS